MTFPSYVKSIVKYRSPHPQDLSFLKGEILRVNGYADRVVETDGQADSYDDDEDDRWYAGESLDGSKQGQFPASLVERVEDVAEPETKTQEQAVQPISIVSSQASPAVDACIPDKESTVTEQPPEQSKVEEQDAKDAECQTPGVDESAVPIEVPEAGKQEATSLNGLAPTDAEDEAKEPQCPPPASVTVNQAESISTTSLSPETHGSSKELTSTETHVPQEPMTENNGSDTVTTNKETIQSTETEGNASSPSKINPTPANSEIDPSRLSLRDRIAAFNKTANKAPPPIPKGKPNTWKRPSITSNAEKPLLPNQVPPALATSSAARVEKVPDTKDCDASAETNSSSFSASDAKSSIKMSLKERMAALQRGHEGGVAIPGPSSERAMPIVTKQEEENHDTPVETTEEEAIRRAAIAKRMAALGGRRVDAGLFASTPAPPSEAAALTENSPKQDDIDTSKEEKKEPVTESGTSTDAPQPLAVPKRTAAPRKRRGKPTETTSPVNREHEEKPEMTTSELVAPPQHSELAHPVEQHILPTNSDENHQDQSIAVGVPEKDPEQNSSMENGTQNNETFPQETRFSQDVDSVSTEVLPESSTTEKFEETKEAAAETQEAASMSEDTPSKPELPPIMTHTAEDQGVPSAPKEEPLSYSSLEDVLSPETSSSASDIINKNAGVSTVTYQVPTASIAKQATNTPVVPTENPPSVSLENGPPALNDTKDQVKNENNDFSAQQDLLNHLLQSDQACAPTGQTNDSDVSDTYGAAKAMVPEEGDMVQQEDPEASEKARREAITRRLARMGGQRIAAGTIRKVQRKAIDLHQKYILHLEAVKAKSKSTLDSTSANFLVAPTTANDIDMDDDLGVALDDTEDFGTSISENPPDMLGTDVEMSNDPNEPHLSDEVREHLAETRKEILSITQQ
ncbi:assembly of actin patch protein [Malassezia equina]|uniref:Assembly of actin patch protein n=1 Tax=Malassezia equina TaxID=1381935 RepID=A0AAF0EC93_9BASI|nr:assembly of actin patch protein [Malassezia equina]